MASAAATWLLPEQAVELNNCDREPIHIPVFTRVHPGLEGDGVGLALCRKVANHHRGWICAAGRVGHGAAFELFLPRLRSFDG